MKILMVGTGGVGEAAAVIAKQRDPNGDWLKLMVLSDFNLERAQAVSERLADARFPAEKVNARNKDEVKALIEKYQADLLFNACDPSFNETLFDVAYECGVRYSDMALSLSIPHPTDPYHKTNVKMGDYQFAKHEDWEKRGLLALVGIGMDPGAVNVFARFAQKHYFDEIHTIDILDCNGGDHGYPFATNFNPEINLREVSANGSYWENGHWVETKPMEIKSRYNFPKIGEKDMYLLHHEEIESLARNISGVRRIRFFMTFGQSYLTHMQCLENVGMLSTSPVSFNGQEIVPIQFLKELLPDPASLGPRTVGKTNIGCIFTGIKDGKEKTIYIYNVCDHQECYKEVGSQAISYTTGVPAMIGAMMVVTGQWKTPGVFNVEEFDPDPYMEALNQWGLPWVVCEAPETVTVWR